MTASEIYPVAVVDGLDSAMLARTITRLFRQTIAWADRSR
ncbi:hypothetical protein STAN_5687 [Streptomyces sp. CBMAI 2042]|nr:RNAseH domain-containing protein [Streptomyces sp. CBMAI 2042]RLV70159.1 hypothetical protein STAN_5687 [Streptomyces sp. CBMAI 2042]